MSGDFRTFVRGHWLADQVDARNLEVNGSPDGDGRCLAGVRMLTS